MDFHEILYLRIFLKSFEKIQVLLQADKNNGFSWNFIFEDFSKLFRENSSFITVWQDNGYFTWRPIYIFDHISLISS